MGSFGLGFDFGRSFITKILGYTKSRCVNIPDYQTAMLASQLKEQGNEVSIKEKPGNANAYYIHTSLTGYKNDIEMAKLLRNVYFFGATAQALPDLFDPYGKIIEVNKDQKHPAWQLYDYKKFSYFPSLKKKPIFPVVTAYGCKFKCSYCPYSSYYGEWTPRPIKDVVEEIVRNMEKFKARGIIFRDPLFTADKDRVMELLRWVLHYDLEFACETRMECVDFPLLEKMKQSGCRAIHFGVESGNADVARSVNRNFIPRKKVKGIIDYCEEIGIKTTCFFILGFPKDTEETVQQTIDYAIELNPNVAEFFIATPYPGTRFSKEVEKTTDYCEMSGYRLCFKHDNFTPKRLNEIKENAYKKFYLRKEWILKFIGM